MVYVINVKDLKTILIEKEDAGSGFPCYHFMKDKIKQYKKTIIVLLLCMFLTMLLVPFLIPKNTKTYTYGKVRNGFITVGEKSTEIITDLVYTDENGKQYINLINMDGYMNIDVIRTIDTYRIITAKNQITVTYGSSDYSINGINFKEDSLYKKPVMIRDYVYADLDKVIETFGYSFITQENFDQTLVEIILTPSENYNDEDYTELMPNMIPVFQDMPEETKEQIEDKLEKPIEGNHNVEDNSLPTVPEPTAEAKADDTIVVSPEILESLEDEEKYVDHLVSEQEKKDEKWKDVKNELTDTFTNATPQFRQEAYKEISDDVFCFNPGSLGTYGNTITVFHDRADGFYMVVQIGGDWSDQAANVVTPESKAYYQGLEQLYKDTIISVLGENEGNLFFAYLKEHADKTMNGGYISKRNEDGTIVSEYTDGPVGDGLQASTLELSQWCGRKTDDGFEYNVVRNGEGIEIYVF